MRSATRCTQHEADAAGCSGGQHIHERTVYTRAPEPATSWRTAAMLGTPVTASIVIDFAKPRGCTRAIEAPRDMPAFTPPAPVSTYFQVKMVHEINMTGFDTIIRVMIEPSREIEYPWTIHTEETPPRELCVAFLSSSAVYPGQGVMENASGMWYRCDYRDVQWGAGVHDSFLMYMPRIAVERFETLIGVRPNSHGEEELVHMGH